MPEKRQVSRPHSDQNRSCRIATGFTTSFLGDERTLREFIIGEELRKKLSSAHGEVTLYLINDDFDPLTDRQLRIAVNKDEKAIARHQEFLGRPIAEIPDPAGCHESHAKHFETLLMQRLAHLGIFPKVINTYRSYQEGRYQSATNTVFERYDQIKEILSKKFHPFTLRNLFRIQCPVCQRIDETSITSVKQGVVSFRCEPCRKEQKRHYREIIGKLSWKLDCAARWNIYEIDHETFSKAHVADLGSLNISAFLSREFFGGRVPKSRSYGHITLSPELRGKILEILPPKLFNALFTSNPVRDLMISSTSLIEFCRQQPVLNGFNYISYIKSELPKKRLCVRDLAIEEAELVSYAEKFSKNIFQKNSEFRLPSEEILNEIPLDGIKSAMEVISWSIGTRNESSKTHSLNGAPEHENRVRDHLKSLHLEAAVYKNLRKLFSQEEGPSIPTLLETLPVEFLDQTLQIARSFMEREGEKGIGGERRGGRLADGKEEF
jgi:lysyl-tRNA synthetase class I